jgi:SsrA-binding protein
MPTQARPKPAKETPANSTVAGNRRAYHDYFIDETIEAGLVLTGTEVKSVRAGRVNLREAYARIENGEAWLWNAHISPYDYGNRYNHEPQRTRKLLLHRTEISRLNTNIKKKGYTLVPVRIYFKRNHAKVELGLARGKKLYDKRDSIAERDAQREIERAMRSRHRDREE